MKRRSLMVIAPLVLSLGIAGTAYATTGHHYGPGGRGGAHYGWSFGRGDAPLGTVQSLSGTTLTVLEFDGTTQTFTVGTNTHYFLDGKSASSSAVVQGLNVVVAGGRSWDASSGVVGAVFLFSPNVLGNIQSVTVGSNGDTIAVLNPQGFAFTIQTSDTTNFWVNGVSSTTAPTFTTGEIIAALGVVDTTNRDQLDATQVNVVPPHHHHS